jgi:hypothetical protein
MAGIELRREFGYGIDQFKRCPLPARASRRLLPIALEGMKLFERHGAHHARLLAATTAGEQSKSYVLTNKFDNAAEYGAFVDELYNDAEMDSFLARIGAEDSPRSSSREGLATEIRRSGTERERTAA